MAEAGQSTEDPFRVRTGGSPSNFQATSSLKQPNLQGTDNNFFQSLASPDFAPPADLL